MNRLSAQMQRYFDDFVGKERSRDFPPEIINALQELAELPKHLSVDLEGLLRQAASEGIDNRSFRQALLGFLRKFFHDDIRRETESCLERMQKQLVVRMSKRPLCPCCGTEKVIKNGTHNGKQKFSCKECRTLVY